MAATHLATTYVGAPCKYGHGAIRSVVRGDCVECKRLRDLRYSRQNAERGALRAKAWYLANTARAKAANKDWESRNRDKVNAAHRALFRRQPHVAVANSATRRAAKDLRTPPWFYTPAQRQAVKAVYAEARAATVRTGIKHVVDHIYPLRGKTVSGLHVAENLRVVPQTLNMEKGRMHPEAFLLS